MNKAMEQSSELSTVFVVNTPFSSNEEEVASSYILTENIETDENLIDLNEGNSSVSDTIVTSSISGEKECDVSVSEHSIIPDESTSDTESDKLTCEYCSKKFTKSGNKQRHVRRVHKVRTEHGTYIRCIECNCHFSHISRLREHLQMEHKMNMQEEELRFPNMNAFKKWKCETERKTLCSYTLRHGARKSSQGAMLFYACHRSGKYLPKLRGPRQRMLKTQGTCKLGIICTAYISCRENANEVIVKYCPHHYGHGKETALIQLTAEEQRAIAESVSKGIPVEKLLDGIRDSQSPKDHFQLHLLKKKDFRSINNAYNCEEYNNGLSDAESVDHWVRLCCQMENSPILAYRQEDFVNEDGRQDEFLLIIMTEFQKHILLTSNKEVVCVDSLFRKKGSRFYLTVLFIMDEHDLAFPVAFCISNKVDRYVITQFFQAIKQSTGPLSATYFMSDSLSLYYDAWKEIMNDEAKWLWSMWYVDSRIRVQMRIFKGNTAKRADVYKTMRTLLECQNETVFSVMFENFLENLLNDPQSRELGNFIKQHYGCNQEMWAYCYRKDINLSTNIHLEIMHRTLRYCCREGRKKRLDKFIFVLMKLVRDKMLDRLSNSVDEEKINLAHESINACHSLGLEIPADEISALSEKIWLIRSDEENFYVSRELMTCPEHCNLKCEECDICVHMFTCNCIHNLINANLCPHIHAVVWNFLAPHFTHPVSDQGTLDESVDDNVIINTKDSSELFSSVLKKTHELYKNIQSNKCNLNKESLNALLKRLNDCIDVCNGKVPDNPQQAEKNESSTPSSTALYVKNNVSQPLILPNHFPNAFPQNTPVSQYVILLPSNK